MAYIVLPDELARILNAFAGGSETARCLLGGLKMIEALVSIHALRFDD